MISTYKGRFAPTPSGPAHLGTLLAAVGSYLQAQVMQGEWHVRIDDIDPPRELAGAADSILRTLESYGLHWDGPVVYQSQRQQTYEDALQQLISQSDTFNCDCSRKDIKSIANMGPGGMIYPGTCRNNSTTGYSTSAAIRLKTQAETITVNDKIQAAYTLNMHNDVGDFIIRRADGLIAYHLATVVDDALDGFTEIVRGKDQLSLTPQHIFLQKRLNLPSPDYAHLPLLTNPQGEKLAKSCHPDAVNDLYIPDVWESVLTPLGLNPPPDLLTEKPHTILDWSIEHWDLSQIDPEDKIVE